MSLLTVDCTVFAELQFCLQIKNIVKVIKIQIKTLSLFDTKNYISYFNLFIYIIYIIFNITDKTRSIKP